MVKSYRWLCTVLYVLVSGDMHCTVCTCWWWCVLVFVLLVVVCSVLCVYLVVLLCTVLCVPGSGAVYCDVCVLDCSILKTLWN